MIPQKIQRHNSDADFLSFVVENEDNYDAVASVEIPGNDYFKQLSIQFYSLPTQYYHKGEKKQPKSNIDDNFYQINGVQQVSNRPSLQYQERNGLREIVRLQQSKQPSNKDTATTASSFLYNQTSDVSFTKVTKFQQNQMSPGRVLKKSGDEIKSFINRSIPKPSPEPINNNLDFYSIYDLEQEVINEKKYKNQFIPAKKMLNVKQIYQQNDISTKIEKTNQIKNQIDSIQKKLNKLNQSKEELTSNQQFRVGKTIKLRPKVVLNPNNSQDQLYIQFGNIKPTNNTIIQEQMTNQLILEKQKSKFSFKPQIDLRSYRLQ